jgi:tungstate transport system substrate-binding protein
MRLQYSLIGLCLVAVCGCGSAPAPSITLATTTSVQDSGLLDHLLPLFREESGINVKVIAVGTGQALQLGRRGDADVLIVHDPESEQRFMDEGHGESRRQIMHNDFVIVGPPNDPAGVRNTKSAVAAFKILADKHATFISRGDESGTHLREKRIWQLAEINPAGDWYVRAGGGMGLILGIANEKHGYTLTDRGTYLAFRAKVELAIVHEGDPLLLNRYSVIIVNADKHGPQKHARARRFAEFLGSPATQKVIGEFGVEQFGQPLFIPDVAESQPSS